MEGITFKPTHKLLLCCSAMPVFPGSDDEQRRWFNKIKTMRLKGRFIVGEADEGRKFSAEMCKRLTAGSDLD
jgi:hypothetical protein